MMQLAVPRFDAPNHIPELTAFQVRSLIEVANSELPTYMLIRPNSSDPPEKRIQWGKNNDETDALVALGFLEDVSGAYRKQLDDYLQESGREFRVFQITAIGRLMFNSNFGSSLIN